MPITRNPLTSIVIFGESIATPAITHTTFQTTRGYGGRLYGTLRRVVHSLPASGPASSKDGYCQVPTVERRSLSGPEAGSTGNAMSTATFDTYTAAKRLREAGFNESQAEAAVSMVRDAAGADREQLATKADLAEVRADLAGLETRLRSDLATKADLETLRSEMRWMLAFQAALILAMAAKLFGIV